MDSPNNNTHFAVCQYLLFSEPRHKLYLFIPCCLADPSHSQTLYKTRFRTRKFCKVSSEIIRPFSSTVCLVGPCSGPPPIYPHHFVPFPRNRLVQFDHKSMTHQSRGAQIVLDQSVFAMFFPCLDHFFLPECPAHLDQSSSELP